MREEARKLPEAVPVMARIMTYFMEQAEAEQRKDGGGDAKVISLMLREARTTAAQLAQYQQPKLCGVNVGGDAENPLRTVQELDLSRLTDEQLLTLRPILAALAEPVRRPDDGTATTH
jgi:hypothetical protein